MTEVTAGFFILASLYFFIKHEIYLSGMSAGLAFLFKFPAGLIFFGLFLFLLIDKRTLESVKFSGAFLLTVTPYLVFNLISNGNIISPLISAASHQSNIVYSV